MDAGENRRSSHEERGLKCRMSKLFLGTASVAPRMRSVD